MTGDTASSDPRRPSVGRRLLTTVVAWIAAYAIVNIVIEIGGDRLATAPRAVQTLVLSGAIVVIMVNVLMPLIVVVVARIAEQAARLRRSGPGQAPRRS